MLLLGNNNSSFSIGRALSLKYVRRPALFMYITNASFSTWPATASNQGHPAIANGGFYLPSGNSIQEQACKSACMAFNLDSFCCRGEFGSPDKCKPSLYSKMFKHACPSYFSYAFDSSNPLVACSSDDYIITFCPDSWGGEHMSI
ncbi:hypothetical protein Leryth_014951 [Lithospermum erythrorhizon]|nr:hypothetical protein Leryth_014951 [Lithospermum erythrorhizon]